MKLQSEFSETNADQGLELTNEGFESVFEMKIEDIGSDMKENDPLNIEE